MTVTMDNKNNRKSSWDSKVCRILSKQKQKVPVEDNIFKQLLRLYLILYDCAYASVKHLASGKVILNSLNNMSVSTVYSTSRQYKRSASSILSSDSDIRFTRNKLSSQYKCGCCIIACFLLLLLLAAAAVYVGYTFFAMHPLEEQVFRATFRVTQGDTYLPELADTSTGNFKIRSRDYRERLNLLFRRSKVSHGFAGTEVLALDGAEGKDLVVHFNIHIDPTYIDVEASDLESILSKEISLDESLIFKNLTIETSSLEVKESNALPLYTASTLTTRVFTQVVTQTTPVPRVCSPLGISYCSAVGYNITTYPNFLGHRNVKDVEEDVITFREMVDAECYRHAYQFVCQILQPSCRIGPNEMEMILPCRSFCREFMASCGGRLLPKFKDLLDCSKFSEFGESTCSTKPDCVQEMQSRALSPRICDGVVDCQDLSDERSCTYCPTNHIHCGLGRVCIDGTKRCDGRNDCPDGSDERACLSLAPSVASVKAATIVTPHLSRYNSEGFVIFNEKGEVGKLCTENVKENETIEIFHSAASSLCKSLQYKKLLSVQIEKDTEHNVPYVEMQNPRAPAINFVRTNCNSKQVLKVSCSELECGVQSTLTISGYENLSKMSVHGDWPWHAVLFKEDIHVCDATLVSPYWLVTTASCFQGQPKAEWSAHFGTVRISSSSPWQQERRIVGLVKSPVEGSTIAMVKLDEPVVLTDFVRPICLPTDRFDNVPTNKSHCNTLGWTRNRDQLQRIQIKPTDMEKCENISISTINSFCTEPSHEPNDCSEEEFSGTSMLCYSSEASNWYLAGVSNWRIACSKPGMARPRMYDSIKSNTDWIYQTISAII